MAIVRNITDLSQIADLNGPDGSVDPPTVLDDQDRYLGSFIAMLRDGVGFATGAITTSLGFTPVRQGGQGTMGTSTVAIGWDATASRLLVAVDSNLFSNKWPIDNDGTARGLRSAGAVAGAEVRLNWSDPGGIPAYLHGGNSATDAMVVPPSRLNVNYANSAGTASNANTVSGIGPWRYQNLNFNPPY